MLGSATQRIAASAESIPCSWCIKAKKNRIAARAQATTAQTTARESKWSPVDPAPSSVAARSASSWRGTV
jgi:hypothetical protein